jgi:hypothetical protein
MEIQELPPFFVCVCVVMRMMNDTRIECVVPLNRFVCVLLSLPGFTRLWKSQRGSNSSIYPPPPIPFEGWVGDPRRTDIRLVPYMTAAPCHFLFSPYSDSSSSSSFFCFVFLYQHRHHLMGEIHKDVNAH